MKQLSGSLLRKAACEAIGWRKVDLVTRTVWRIGLDGFNSKVYDPAEPGSYSECVELPEIEKDSGVSETILINWCKLHGFGWDLFTDGTDPMGSTRYTCGIFATAVTIRATAHTPSSARARAIVAMHMHLYGCETS